MKRLLLILLILSLPVSADLAIGNTANWKNIYSAGIYSSLNNHDYKFLISAKHAELLTKEIVPGTKVLVIESNKTPFNRRYETYLEQKGFEADTLLIPEENANLDLARRLDVNSFMIVDPTYGQDAVSVAPLAIETDSYVLFADRDNIDQVAAHIEGTDSPKLIIYGDVDRQVLEALSAYNPEILNEGDRFSNNLAIASRYKQLTGAKQAVLTSGAFLEQDVFQQKTKQPIVFIGQDQSPEDVVEYLKTAGFEALVVIGNELLPAAQQVKEQTGIPMLIKFGKGTTGGDEYKHITGLDTYDVPALELLLNLQGVYYNPKTKTVQLVLKNEKEARTYLRSSIIIEQDGQAVQTVGDDDPVSIEDSELGAFDYDADLEIGSGQEYTADIFTPYGASPNTFEKAITTTVPVTIITDEPECALEIIDAAYDEKTSRFEIKIETSNKCYAQAGIVDITINGETERIIGGAKQVSGAGKLEIKQSLNEADIADNPQITVVVNSGTREDLLIERHEKTFDLKIKTGIDTTYIIIAVLLLIIIILLWKQKKRQ